MTSKFKIHNLVFLMIFCFVLFQTNKVYASRPVLNFSDITNGPSSGLNDGLGEGAIVTVWGNNLGSMQGTSTITIGGQTPAHIYYWKNADGQLPGGPADLYSYHKMQEIAFSIPSSLTNGTYNIQVKVNGIYSNTLPFTVRDGNIYFIKPLGNDINEGSWDNPWQNLQDVFSGNGKLIAGDVVYSLNGSSNGLIVGNITKVAGSVDKPISLIGYPGSAIQITGKPTTGSAVIYNFYGSDNNRASEYINFSKIKIIAGENDNQIYSTGMLPFRGMRVVGLEITGPTAYQGYQGAIGGNHKAAGGGQMLGIYIHNYGRDNGVASAGNIGTEPPYSSDTEKNSWDIFQHVYYLSNRTPEINEGYTIAWNVLENNPMYQGIHIYDQSGSGGWSSPIYIHDNFIKNQRGAGIHIDVPNMTNNPDFFVYNNVVFSDDDDVYNKQAVAISAPYSNVYLYNNSLVGWNQINNMNAKELTVCNNIFLDQKSVGLLYDEPNIHSNNLWETSTGNIPSWIVDEDNAIFGNPQFINTANNDFQLQSTSPAIDMGITVLPVTRDFLGLLRPQGLSYDIGAFEYHEVISITPRADVNQDNQVNTTDALLTLRKSLGLDMSNTNWNNSSTETGDVNCNNSVTTADALLLLRQSVGLDMSSTEWCEGG